MINSYEKCCECEELLKKCNSISMGEDRIKYELRLLDRHNEFCIQVIIFSALSIEAFINDYLFTYLGKKYFETLDKLDVKNKVILGVQMITNQDFSKESKAYFYLHKLITRRNELVHGKTYEVTIDQLLSDTQNIERKVSNLINIADSELNHAIEVYELVIKEISLLQPDLDKKYFVKSEDLRDWYYINCIK